jgi:glyoxylase-like metal-dependent hydrolase (beta-lactamase superfamily II)
MASTAAVELAPQVWRIPTAPADLVNSFAFVDDDGSVTLVDASYSFGVGRLLAGLAAMGKHPADVTRLLLTHAHSDHAGGAAQIVDKAGIDGVTAHPADADFLRAGTGAPRDTTLGGLRGVFARLPGGRNFPPVAVSEEVSAGQTLDVAGGLEVVHTPGHTPGHVSLLHRPSGVMVTGDSIWNMRSRLTWPVLAFCTDVRLTQQTADTLGDLEYDIAAFTHGPEIRDGAREAVRGFLSRAARR